MNDLDEFLQMLDNESPYIKFEDGEPVTGKYVGAEMVDDTFNKGEKTMEYTMEIGGYEKSFKSRSGKLAKLLNGVEEGDTIQLVKTGEAFDTRWYVKKQSKI